MKKFLRNQLLNAKSVENKKRSTIFLVVFLFLFDFSLFGEELNFSQLCGAKRNNSGAGYWELAWGGKNSSADGYSQIFKSALNYAKGGEWQKIGQFYPVFFNGQDCALTLSLTSKSKGVLRIKFAAGEQTVAETTLLMKGEGICQSPFTIKPLPEGTEISISCSGVNAISESSLSIYQDMLQTYPIKNKDPLFGVYFRKFGEDGVCSEIFETDPRVINAKEAEMAKANKENIPAAFFDEESKGGCYRFLCYTKTGTESGIAAPLLGKPDIVLAQRLFNMYDRIIFPDERPNKEGKECYDSWIGKKDEWSMVSELVNSSLFDTNRDGLWNGRKPTNDYINGERLLDNYNVHSFYLDYIIFMPATFCDVACSAGAKLSFTYLDKEKKEKSLSLPLDEKCIDQGKTRIGFINTGKGIEVVQRGGDKEPVVLSSITDTYYPYCLQVKAQSLKVE